MSSQVEPEGFEFPAEVSEDVDGLMYLGYLEDSFEFCGHHFIIRTLRGGEELLGGVVSKEYVETQGGARAWAWALVALSLVSVDHDQAFCPPAGPDKKAYAHARFNYVVDKWYWPTGEYIFRRYTDLLDRQKKAVEAMRDFANGSLSTPTPSPGSWTEKDPSDPPKEDIRDLLD